MDNPGAFTLGDFQIGAAATQKSADVGVEPADGRVAVAAFRGCRV